MKRNVAADIISFMGFTGPFDGSANAARKYRMNLVYDSGEFDANAAVSFLEGLKDVNVSLSNKTIKRPRNRQPGQGQNMDFIGGKEAADVVARRSSSISNDSNNKKGSNSGEDSRHGSDGLQRAAADEL